PGGELPLHLLELRLSLLGARLHLAGELLAPLLGLLQPRLELLQLLLQRLALGVRGTLELVEAGGKLRVGLRMRLLGLAVGAGGCGELLLLGRDLRLRGLELLLETRSALAQLVEPLARVVHRRLQAGLALTDGLVLGDRKSVV